MTLLSGMRFACEHGSVTRCPQCELSTLWFFLPRSLRNAPDQKLTFSLAPIICLLFSNLFGYVNLMVQCQEREINLFQTLQVLFELNNWALSGVMVAFMLPMLRSQILH
jgi:uncharacterized paraquat-inducible protein A